MVRQHIYVYAAARHSANVHGGASTKSVYLPESRDPIAVLFGRCEYGSASRYAVGSTTQIVDTRRRAEVLPWGCGFATVPGLTTVGATLP